MAVLDDLLRKVSDPVLRDRLTKEIHKATKHKKFGLVFEEHLPECTPLFDVPIKKGSRVAVRDIEIKETFTVLSVEDRVVKCISNNDKEMHEFPLKDLVTVAEFGEPIYPYLQTIDTVCNAPDSELWHTLIEADNYHALQLLEYMYAGKVDCIYIDPPYNTGKDEWRYNDAFVDSNDLWAHSKWLSFMKRRLLLAKKVLSLSGALIISIGYQQIHRLTMLCEEIFPDRQVVPITVQTSGGKPSGGFNYLHEYLLFVVPQSFSPKPTAFAGGHVTSPYHGMTLASFTQYERPNQVYPIFCDENTGEIKGCGKSLQERVNDGSYKGELDDFIYDYSEAPAGCVCVWPVSNKGQQCVWRLIPSRFMSDVQKGYIRVLPQKSRSTQNVFSVQFLSAGIIEKINNKELAVVGREPINNTLILDQYFSEGTNIPTIWNDKLFYTSKGTSQIQDVFKEKEFPYPKPIALIMEAIRSCTTPNGLVLDFFAGSATTLVAVNLLNEQDNGHRQCILVTNNELSKKQMKKLRQEGVKPGSEPWESQGICRAVAWPRIKNTILGKCIDSTELNGVYDVFGDDDPVKQSDGFEVNAIYFRLGFLEKNAVALGRQFKELLGVLWMKAGAIGPCPHLTKNATIPEMMILPQNKMAILVDDTAFATFAEQMKQHPEIETVYIVTDSDRGYREMSRELGTKNTYQLYRDYLDNFRINHRR